jgi:ABC-2 type transport system permease protein
MKSTMTVFLNSATVARRILRELARNRRMLMFWAAFPALMLVLFGLIYAGGGGTASSFDRTAPGILVGAALFFSCLGGPVATVVAERESETLRRLLLSPLSGASYFLGVVWAFSVVAAGQAFIVGLIAAAFGGRFHGSLLLGAAILALCVTSYCGLGFFFGAHFARRTEDVNGPVAAFGVPLLVLGGTFFPPAILPRFLLRAAEFDPVFHMNEALKAVAAGGAGAVEIRHHLLVLGGFALLSLALGIMSYRRLLTVEQGS